MPWLAAENHLQPPDRIYLIYYSQNKPVGVNTYKSLSLECTLVYLTSAGSSLTLTRIMYLKREVKASVKKPSGSDTLATLLAALKKARGDIAKHILLHFFKL